MHNSALLYGWIHHTFYNFYHSSGNKYTKKTLFWIILIAYTVWRLISAPIDRNTEIFSAPNMSRKMKISYVGLSNDLISIIISVWWLLILVLDLKRFRSWCDQWKFHRVRFIRKRFSTKSSKLGIFFRYSQKKSFFNRRE